MAAQETAIQTNMPRWKKFFREVRAELKKVTWPTKNELISYTGIVFISVVIVAVLIWVIDAALAKVLALIIK
ncbi:preprotein translocase subunit SecE [Anaerospora hongkongensis]|jgi:preprotein translocase subunit SecE|uniref:Protein translocase subunit SecE n=1 Tax=Anaerospora hongkongensis TaxID=244830 RepID=A0A4V2Q7E6_9FIRM|nr:preprotein translocase subunit SecE [Anaerospora hongkongensis]TCL31562.1 preprotein translocase subunit SecE [Anaerospora hongkongensis]